MKEYIGYFKAFAKIKVNDDATEEEIRTRLADKLSDQYFTWVYPRNIEGIKEATK